MQIEELIVSETLQAFIGFVKVIIIIWFIDHWIACIFYAVGSFDLDSEPMAWVVQQGIVDSTVEEKYITSLYWALTTTTTVGYGDISPSTRNERIYAMFGMILACGVFAFIIGSIETILKDQSQSAAQFKEKILHTNQYLMARKVPKPLRDKVRRYLENRL